MHLYRFTVFTHIRSIPQRYIKLTLPNFKHVQFHFVVYVFFVVSELSKGRSLDQYLTSLNYRIFLPPKSTTEPVKDPSLTEFHWPSFAEIATSLGGKGLEVHSEEELEVAIAALETRNGPVPIELQFDPHDVPRIRI